ncbi:MAG: hypothetical protein R6W71_07345 [Bacteroidales bacterium]
MKTLIFILILALCGCHTNHKVSQDTGKNDTVDFTPKFIPGPQALVYKTKADYNHLVPVLLSEDKTEIVSFPHPSDLKIGDSYPLPTVLNNGYLLDNRGIGLHVAFLSLTYEDYARLERAPSITELHEWLIDKDPLLELCDCGTKGAFSDITKQLNRIIDENKLRTICKVIK